MPPGEEPTLSNKLLWRNNKGRVSPLRGWARPTCLPRGSNQRRWIVFQRSPKLSPNPSCRWRLRPRRWSLLLAQEKERDSWWALSPLLKNRSSSSVKILSMRWSISHPSSQLTIIRTWATMQLKPWGRRGSLALLRSTFSFPSLQLALLLTLLSSSNVNDEGVDG